MNGNVFEMCVCFRRNAQRIDFLLVCTENHLFTRITGHSFAYIGLCVWFVRLLLPPPHTNWQTICIDFSPWKSLHCYSTCIFCMLHIVWINQRMRKKMFGKIVVKFAIFATFLCVFVTFYGQTTLRARYKWIRWILQLWFLQSKVLETCKFCTRAKIGNVYMHIICRFRKVCAAPSFGLHIHDDDMYTQRN